MFINIMVTICLIFFFLFGSRKKVGIQYQCLENQSFVFGCEPSSLCRLRDERTRAFLNSLMASKGDFPFFQATRSIIPNNQSFLHQFLYFRKFAPIWQSKIAWYVGYVMLVNSTYHIANYYLKYNSSDSNGDLTRNL